MKLVLVFLFFSSLIYATNRNDSTQANSISQKVDELNSADVKYYIDEIKILGTKKTKPETILKELDINSSKPITKQDITYFEKRIFSLGLFSDVEIFVVEENKKNILVILVQEAWYIWPLPFVDITDRDFKKLTYGINLSIQNIDGRNERLNTGFSLGYDPKFYLRYYNPNFNYEKNLSIYFSTSIQKRKNRSIEAIKVNNKNYDEKYFNLELGLGKRLNIYNSISTSIGFEYVQIDDYFPLRTISSSGKDKAITVQLNYNYDTRDFSAYPRTGSNLNLTYRKVGLTESEIDYNIFVAETKKIFFLGFPILYVRNFSRLLFGPQFPYYANSFIGYRERLRGYFNSVYEGNSLTLNTIEIRLPLVEKSFFEFDLPLIPKELLTYNISIDFHAFFDNGLIANKNQKFKNTKALNGFGFGMSFLILPYRAVNLEVAWNSKFQPQFIFDINFPF
ncbi:MAG: BamA/TamA family outer membrane protein [Ignavibacteria bacterium]|nr:BamA/TamA family outer membrane protein [Ignavibacteria bacterium]